jgi:hypothetical protein
MMTGRIEEAPVLRCLGDGAVATYTYSYFLKPRGDAHYIGHCGQWRLSDTGSRPPPRRLGFSSWHLAVGGCEREPVWLSASACFAGLSATGLLGHGQLREWLRPGTLVVFQA